MTRLQVVLIQTFPLGRFHATPWKVNPFDDPHGEWPPSPWRLVRAVMARWHQWNREVAREGAGSEIDELLRALCESSYRFHLPVYARRGGALRQYQPVEFGWKPAERKKAATRSYGTSLVQDNYWCVPADDGGSVWWLINGDYWTPQVLETLDRCLDRIVYFGRAETLTHIHRTAELPPEPNCELLEKAPSVACVRVLAPAPSATRIDVERTTEDPSVVERNIPPGTRVLYAEVPHRPPVREQSVRPPARREMRLIQLAVGWNVPPEPRAVARLTARFRSTVLRELLRIKANRNVTWSTAEVSVRRSVAQMFGKDEHGTPLKGHTHTEFLAWWEYGQPTRLLVWRSSRPFDADEEVAVLNAATIQHSWAAAGLDAESWKIRLIPLDSAVPPPPGFDDSPAAIWRSVTPYVPPRHHLRAAKSRPSESLLNQIRRELNQRGVSYANRVEVAEIDDPSWVAVHLPRRMRGDSSFNGDRRGHWIEMTFPEPVVGPVRLGHSASFGLGLFRPVLDRSFATRD